MRRARHQATPGAAEGSRLLPLSQVELLAGELPQVCQEEQGAAQREHSPAVQEVADFEDAAGARLQAWVEVHVLLQLSRQHRPPQPAN